MELRWYQQQSIDAVYQFLRERNDNPCVEIPTGGGKTPVIATIARDAVQKWGGRVCILASRKELIEQTAGRLKATDNTLDVGVFSASLGGRSKRNAITVAQIQSIAKRATEFDPFDLILVDEAHEIPPSGEGRYRTFLQECKVINPHVRLIGFTATPYRLGCGEICGPDNLLNEVCFRVGVKELIGEGFLSPLTSKEGQRCDTSRLHVKGGEFVEKEAAQLMLSVVGGACVDLVKRTEQRKSTLVFCCGVDHAEEVAARLQKLQPRRVELVTGQSVLENRDSAVAGFKSGDVAYLVNVDIFTTGFDAPNVDCVAMLRPTMSPGLYYQIVGRGFRICEGKENCLVLDYAGNIERHGPVDEIRIPWRKKTQKEEEDDEPKTKTCKQCQEIYAVELAECPECGATNETHRIPKHDDKPAEGAPISGQDTSEYEADVSRVEYQIHKKKGDPDAPYTMRVNYWGGLTELHGSEWVCLDHEEDSYARQKANEWLSQRYLGTVDSVATGVKVGNAGGFREPLKIRIKRDKKTGFPRIYPIDLQQARCADVVIDEWEFPEHWRAAFSWYAMGEIREFSQAIFGCEVKTLPESQYQELIDALERSKQDDFVEVPF